MREGFIQMKRSMGHLEPNQQQVVLALDSRGDVTLGRQARWFQGGQLPRGAASSSLSEAEPAGAKEVLKGFLGADGMSRRAVCVAFQLTLLLPATH